jgi:hypothetical protein
MLLMAQNTGWTVKLTPILGQTFSSQPANHSTLMIARL